MQYVCNFNIRKTFGNLEKCMRQYIFTSQDPRTLQHRKEYCGKKWLARIGGKNILSKRYSYFRDSFSKTFFYKRSLAYSTQKQSLWIITVYIKKSAHHLKGNVSWKSFCTCFLWQSAQNVSLRIWKLQLKISKFSIVPTETQRKINTC